ELSAFEMGMRLKGAELIYIPDPAIDPAGEAQRVPYRLGWMPGGLLELSDHAGLGEFDRAAAVAVGTFGWWPFLKMSVNDRRNDERDAYF
ncbi:hypothetical protein, partial [Acinetobacter baumannii]|uniref:hypothetical protein n=1 Tax=Acinetobacter baumannii TaxID=470 RepID=UPI001C08BAD0